MRCPTCNGTGNGGPVHRHKINGGGCWDRKSICPRCDGFGKVPDEMAEWIIVGNAMRKARIDRGESLGDAAQRIGISSSELSAFECGRKRPVLG
jgi:hypothetical protein